MSISYAKGLAHILTLVNNVGEITTLLSCV